MDTCSKLFAFSMVIATSVCSAQSSCEAVYAGSTRNIDAVSKQAIEYQELYAKHCENDGSIKSTNSSQDFSARYKEISASFSGTNTEAEQAMQSFCKERHSLYSSAKNYLANTSTVVKEALSSFNQCKLLEGKALHMSHTSGTDFVIIRGDFNADNANVTVDNVKYNQAAGTCTSTSVHPPQPISVHEKMDSFTPRKTFTITCARSGTKMPDGSKRYPPFEVLVGTNIGSYAVALQGEELLTMAAAHARKKEHAEQLAVEKDLTNKILTHATTISALNKSLDGITVTSNIYNDTGCGGFQGTCPAPSKLADKVFVNPSGGMCGYYFYAYSCVTIPGH